LTNIKKLEIINKRIPGNIAVMVCYIGDGDKIELAPFFQAVIERRGENDRDESEKVYGKSH
jgi:hypothetical protein